MATEGAERPPQEGGCGTDSVLGGLSQGAFDRLREHLAAELVANLSQKEEEMWRRGQTELKKLQQEHQAQLSALNARVAEAQKSQEVLMTENAEMRQMLINLTSKLEFVMGEVGEAIRSLPACSGTERASLSLSLASTTTTESLKDNRHSTPIGTGVEDPLPRRLPTPARGVPGDFTPLGASPTVLSLAQALPDSPSRSKALSLAECLETPMSPTGHSEVCNGLASPSAKRSFDFITVELIKEPGNGPLGIEVSPDNDGNSLRIDGVDQDGLVSQYNAQQENAHKVVRAHDRIIDVNGVARIPSLMLEECKSRSRLVLTIARDPVNRVELDAHGGRETSTMSTPQSTLRPDANVFVPPGMDSLRLPPGLACRPQEQAVSPKASCFNEGGTQGSAERITSPKGDTGVKRTLFS